MTDLATIADISQVVIAGAALIATITVPIILYRSGRERERTERSPSNSSESDGV